jgi:hypothetical protein
MEHPSSSEIHSAIEYIKDRIKYRPPGSDIARAIEILDQAILELIVRRQQECV